MYANPFDALSENDRQPALAQAEPAVKVTPPVVTPVAPKKAPAKPETKSGNDKRRSNRKKRQEEPKKKERKPRIHYDFAVTKLIMTDSDDEEPVAHTSPKPAYPSLFAARLDENIEMGFITPGDLKLARAAALRAEAKQKREEAAAKRLAKPKPRPAQPAPTEAEIQAAKKQALEQALELKRAEERKLMRIYARKRHK